MPRPSQSHLRNLGQMLGNIAAGIFADPHNPPKRLQDPPPAPPTIPPAPHFTPPQPPPSSPPPAPHVINTRVQTATIDTPQGPVHLRRTVIDEVVPPQPPPQP